MLGAANECNTRPGRSAVRGLLIVAQDWVDLYEFLQRAYGDSEELALLLDRRKGDRRRAVQSVSVERRHGERRRLPAPSDDLRLQPYVLARTYR